ncbi:MAG TPA: hypothetical protein VFT99_00175, partial [Roseiflexaceae bacterium]|nr:hypothetical protein [Roseiflexaceae bacterium]
MSRRVYVFLLALLAVLGAQFAPAAHQAASAASERPVIAFYYPWYEPGDWSYNRMSDVAAPTYSGGDDATLRRHLQQAADAGIDTLVCAWFGPHEERLNKRCRRLLELAQADGRVQIAIMPEQAAWGALNSVGALAEALGVVERDMMGSPAYFRFHGKPVVFWFNPGSLGGVEAWNDLRRRADPDHAQFWFGGTDTFAYLDSFDALYYYDITWESSPGVAMASYGRRLASWNQSRGDNRPFVATVMPGYDDLKIRNGHRRDRENGAYYRTTWQTAIDRRADAVVLTSFNEFFEGSYIEPSERYGDLYLRLTRELGDQFRASFAAGQPVAPVPLPAGPCRTFAETGHQVCGRMLKYWEQNGGLPVFGFPITDQAAREVEGT